MGTKYTLCIPTFMRPHQLDTLLDGVFRQKWKPNREDLEIVIADNDAKQSANWVIEKWKPLMPFPINYFVVEQRGLANVRNALLDAANNENVILLDDDQSVPEMFFCLLDENWQQRQDGVVAASCRVEPVFEPGFADYLKEMVVYAYSTKLKHESEELDCCGTNGAIFSLAVARANNIRFDLGLNLIGGEDTQFFLDTGKFGKIISFPNVVVFESYPLERGTLFYWIAVAFNRGTVFSAIQLRRKNYYSMTKIFGVSSAAVILGPVLSPLLLIMARGKAAYFFQHYFRQLGKLVGLTGYTQQFYASLGSRRKVTNQ